MRFFFLLVLWTSLASIALSQSLYVLAWTEGDLNSDGVPERVFIVSPHSSDPANQKSSKFLVVMEYHNHLYQEAFQMPIKAGFLCRTTTDHMSAPVADIWGLHYLPPAGGEQARVKVTFTPGSGEFFFLLHDGQGYRVQSSGD